MSARDAGLIVLICLASAGALGQAQVNPRIVTTKERLARPISHAVDAIAVVAPQPAPPVAHAPPAAVSAALNAVKLDEGPIAAGKVTAVNGGRAEQVTLASLTEQVAQKKILIESTRSVATAVSLSPALQSHLTDSGSSASATKGLELGYRILAYESGPGQKAVQLVPFLIDPKGLLLDAAAPGYIGTVVIALLSESNHDASGALDSAVSVLVTAKGADAIDPQIVRFMRYGPNEPQLVTIRVANPPNDAFQVAASADFGTTYNYAELAVSRPTVLIVHPQPDVIPGWGIGMTTLSIQVSDIRSPERLPILFKGDIEGLSANPVALDKNGVGAVQWRSHGTGSATIAIATPGLTADPINVTFAAPWSFLMFAGAGGLVGAFLRGKGRDRWPTALLVGVVTAVLMVVAYALGFGEWVKGLTGGSTPALTGEAIVVVLGAAAALLGVTAFVPSTAKKD
jgi:hypothetical protein